MNPETTTTPIQQPGHPEGLQVDQRLTSQIQPLISRPIFSRHNIPILFVVTVMFFVMVMCLFVAYKSQPKIAALTPAPAQSQPPPPLFMTLKDQEFLRMENVVILNLDSKRWNALKKEFPQNLGRETINIHKVPAPQPNAPR